MAITYPLTPPAELKSAKIQWTPKSVVGVAPSIFTGQQQVYAHQGQWWEVTVTTPNLTRAQGAIVQAFLCALNGREGTFYLGDPTRPGARGTARGTWTVDTGASKGSTTLPIAAGSGGVGSFALGDWLQVGTSLYLVTKLNSGSVDVFPRLRAAHSSGTAITYTNPVGVFRLTDAVSWTSDDRKLYDQIIIPAIEVIPTT